MKESAGTLGFGGCDGRNLKTQYKSNDPGRSIQRGCSEWGNGGVNGDWREVNGVLGAETKSFVAGVYGFGARQKSPDIEPERHTQLS
jgi:hypothetical protein